MCVQSLKGVGLKSCLKRLKLVAIKLKELILNENVRKPKKNQPIICLRIWNVRILFTAGKLDNAILEIKRPHVHSLALQSIKCTNETGTFSYDSINGLKIILTRKFA